MEEPKRKRGGARPGSGPKPADGAKDLHRVLITIDPKSDATAKLIGEGDRSLGIRRALAIAQGQIDGTHKPVRTKVRGTQPVRTANPKPKKETP